MLMTNTACGGTMELRLLKDYDDIDKEFTPYVQEFIYASEGKVTKRKFYGFTMGFRDYEGGSVVGTCHPVANEVDINREWWNKNQSQAEKIELVFHELGHCILHRGHTQQPFSDDFAGWIEGLGFKIGLFEEKGKLPDGCPASFMHPYTLGEDCISKHFNFYIKELFKQERKNYIERLGKTYRAPSHEVSCSKTPEVINKTNTWTQRDEATYRRAKVRCVESYHACLKTFWKKTNRSYAALCE